MIENSIKQKQNQKKFNVEAGFCYRLGLSEMQTFRSIMECTNKGISLVEL